MLTYISTHTHTTDRNNLLIVHQMSHSNIDQAYGTVALCTRLAGHLHKHSIGGFYIKCIPRVTVQGASEQT